VTKLTVAFRNFANAPGKAHFGSRMNPKAKNIFKELVSVITALRLLASSFPVIHFSRKPWTARATVFETHQVNSENGEGTLNGFM
jgi:hypothetical protein